MVKILSDVSLSTSTDDLTVGGTIELGHATDTTLSRSAAGTLAVEGVDVSLSTHSHGQYLADSGDTLTGTLTISNTGSLTVWGATSTAATQVTTRVDGEANTRWGVRADGFQAWGDGTLSRDTNLYRSAANTLATDDNFEVGQNLTVSGDIIHPGQLDFSASGGVAASVTSSGLYLPAGKKIVLEGATDDGFETSLTVADPTADRTITLPDATGTVSLTGHTHSTSDVTSGNFAATVTGGTGVTVTGGTGNASNPSIAIGQAVGTTSDVTFNDVTLAARLKHATQLTFNVAATDAASVLSTGFYMPSGKTIKFEGTTDNGFETDLTVIDPTADNTISLPDLSGTVALTSQVPPTGSIVMWPTATAPTDWLFLDGSTYNQSTYPALAAVFGVVSGTFTLPDMRDRFAAGASTVSALANNAGTFAPNTANATAHDHTTNIAHAHADTIAVSTHADHTHNTDPAATTSGAPSATFNLAYSGGATNVSIPTTTHTHSTNIASTASGAETSNLTHTVTGGVTSLGATSVTSSSAGGTLTPKATLLNFIIKT
jgi:hypothetical protein